MGKSSLRIDLEDACPSDLKSKNRREAIPAVDEVLGDQMINVEDDAGAC